MKGVPILFDFLPDDEVPPTCVSEEIWMKNSGLPTARDLEAREFLCDIYESDEFQVEFSKKGKTKTEIWTKVVKKMVQAGFNFGSRFFARPSLKKKETQSLQVTSH